MQWLQQHYFWILPELDESWSLDAILNKAKTLIFRHGINGLIIDPWNEIEHFRPNNLSETEYISMALSKIRRFARVYNVHVWVVAHPAKIRKDPKTGNYPVPTPYDISGSAHWRNKADNCITVFRNFKEKAKDHVDIYIQKIRFKEIGRIGDLTLRYDTKDSNYFEISASDN